MLNLLLLFIFVCGTLEALGGEVHVLLPGSRLTLELAEQKSTDVVAGVFRTVGNIDLGPPGRLDCSGAKIEIERSLKGSLRGSVICSYIVIDDPRHGGEALPMRDVKYVLFIDTKAHQVIKILSAETETQLQQTLPRPKGEQ